MADPDAAPWFAGKVFSTDWTSSHIPVWMDALRARRGEILSVLEIGSWEGRFDANLAEFGSRVEKIKATSTAALARLAIAHRRFNVVYVDASHHAADVFADAALCWPMVVPGGVVIFDDYEWQLMPDEDDRPKRGVDAFLAASAGHYRELHRGYQIIVEKTVAAAALEPARAAPSPPEKVAEYLGFNIVRAGGSHIGLRQSLGVVTIDRDLGEIARQQGFSNAAIGPALGDVVMQIQLLSVFEQLSQTGAELARVGDRLTGIGEQLAEAGAAGHAAHTRLDALAREMSDLSGRTGDLKKDFVDGAVALQRSMLALSRRIKE